MEEKVKRALEECDLNELYKKLYAYSPEFRDYVKEKKEEKEGA